jgi:hypothetical protein
VSEPVEYVNLWVRDASEPYNPARVQAWLDWFDANAVEAVGFGLVTIRRGGRADPAPGVRLTQEAEHDGQDWAVGRQVLSLASGLRWADEVDPVALALVSGATGTVTARDQVAVLAAATQTPESVFEAQVQPLLEHLVERGFLLPASPA